MKPQTLQKTAPALLVGWYAANAAAYSEQGQAGNTKSWESAEYLKDWGLTSMNSSTAYALGFNGSGVKIGVMDSGVLKHCGWKYSASARDMYNREAPVSTQMLIRAQIIF